MTKLFVMPIVIVAASVGCSASAAPASAPSTLPTDYAGCYQLSLISSPTNIPYARVSLLEDPYEPHQEYRLEGHWLMRRLDRAGTARELRWNRAFWKVAEGADSLRLTFTDGWTGDEFVLGIREDSAGTLSGRAVRVYDYGPPFEVAAGAARADRIAC